MTTSPDETNPLLGVWRIERTEIWGRDDLDLLGEAHIVFLEDDLGSLRVGAMEAELDYRLRETPRGWRADFSFSGFDDGSPTSGRGWVRLGHGNRLSGRLFVHLGDECGFSARRGAEDEAAGPDLRAGPAPLRDPAEPSPSFDRDVVAVRLADILEALEYPEEWDVFLDRRTGRIVALTENERPYLEGEDPGVEEEDVPDWLRSSIEDIRSVLETGDPVRLPDKFDIHEWSIMRRFADTREEPARREILAAIHGRGAFRHFRATTERLGLREAWFRHRGEALERIAREWAEGERVRLVEEGGSSPPDSSEPPSG